MARPSETFTIEVTNLNDKPVVGPTDTDGATGGSVAENAVNGTAVGHHRACHRRRHGATISYSLTEKPVAASRSTRPAAW